MNINARFEEIINSLYKGNKRAFAQSVGISATVVENVVGTRKGKPSYDVLEKVCANANISAEWLLTGKGEMQRAEDRQLAIPAIKEQFSLRTDRTIGMQSVPLYELDATAGLGALFDGTTRQVPVSHLQIPDLPPCDGALYVRGDSMYPLLKSGDIVLFGIISSRPCDAVKVDVSAPLCSEPCTAPAAPASDCISITLTVSPKMFLRP